MYNGAGKKTSRTTDGETTYYVYDGNTVILELDDEKSEAARNVYGRNIVSRDAADSTLYFNFNGHGDVISLADELETIVVYEYDEFGNQLSETIVSSGVTDVNNPYRYVGYEYLDEVELYDLNARYYDPGTARFLSEDPYYNLGNRVIGLYEINVPSAASIMQANNIYAYCGNNPIIYIDENGEVFFLVTAAIFAVAGGIAGAIYSQVKYGEVRWQNVAAGAAIGGAVGATGGAAAAYVTTGSVAASTSTVFAGVGTAAVATVPVIQELYNKVAPHMFSKAHINNGIMNLGSSQIDIFNKVTNIAMNNSSKWAAGSNEIRTVINGIETTIRFHVVEGELVNIDAFVGYSERIIGNLIG